MNKITLLIIELCAIVAGLWATNLFVENVLDPDYTANWQSRDEWIADGRQGGMPPDKDVYHTDIMRKRSSDRVVFFLTFGLLVAGYYSAKAARGEIHRRGIIVPADGTEPLDAATAASNRNIAGLRFLSIVMSIVFFVTFISCVSMHPMQNLTESGGIANTNPFFGDDFIARFLFCSYMPIALCLAPYFAFRKISTIFSFRFCLKFFLIVVGVIALALLIGIRTQHGARAFGALFAGLPLFVEYGKKMDKMAKVLGI